MCTSKMIVLWVFFALNLGVVICTEGTFVIGGLFPLGLKDPNFRLLNGVYPKIAAELAVDDVNSAGFLASYNVRVKLQTADSNCDGDDAVSSYLQFLQGLNSETPSTGLTAIPPYVILGPACNNAAYSTASLTSKYTKDIQVSYAASTPLLSDAQQLPLFYRTVPSYMQYNKALYSLMTQMEWWNIAIIREDESHYTAAVESLAEYLDAKNQEGLNGEDERSKASIVSVTSLNGFLESQNPLMETTRIFVAMVPEDQAAVLMCSAFLLGMTTENYQWILLGDYFATWQWKIRVRRRTLHRNIQCSANDLNEAMEAAIFLTHQQLVSDPEVQSNFNGRQVRFWNEYQSRIEDELKGGFQSRFSFRGMATYDAVWAISAALGRVLKKTADRPKSASRSYEVTSQSEGDDIGDFSIETRGRMASQAVLDFNLAMEQINISGINSRIEFNSDAHSPQNPVTYLLQVQSDTVVPIAKYFPTNDSVNYYSRNFTWKGGSFPRDRPVVQLRVASVYVVGVMIGFSILGIALSGLLLLVNWVYRKHKVIKASSPYMNFVIITGCIFGFLSVSFLSMENLDVNGRIPAFAYYFLCNLRSFLLSTGFTLSFGALFAKTFRIYWIFRDPWSRKRAAKDSKLLAYIGGLLVYDILIIVLWVSHHPLSLVMVKLNYNPVAFTEEQYCFCAPKTASLSAPTTTYNFLLWIGLITVPKAILLAFGIFLIVQTGYIKALFFRDAKFTGIAIFGVMISCGAGVPTAIFTMQLYQTNITFIASTSTILTCSFLILIMVFVPKLILLRKYRKKVPARVLIGLNPSFRVRRNISPNRSTASPTELYWRRGAVRRQPIRRSAQVHDDRARQSEQAYAESEISCEDSQSIQQAEMPSSGNTEIVVESLEDWWEPAFEESTELEGNCDVEEDTVHIKGYHGVISVIRTRARTGGCADTKQSVPPSSNIRHTVAGQAMPHYTSMFSLHNGQHSVQISKNLAIVPEINLEEDCGSHDNHHHIPYYRFASYTGADMPESPDSVTVNICKSKSCSFVQNKNNC